MSFINFTDIDTLIPVIEIENETNNLESIDQSRLLDASMSQYSVECASTQYFDDAGSN